MLRWLKGTVSQDFLTWPPQIRLKTISTLINIYLLYDSLVYSLRGSHIKLVDKNTCWCQLPGGKDPPGVFITMESRLPIVFITMESRLPIDSSPGSLDSSLYVHHWGVETANLFITRAPILTPGSKFTNIWGVDYFKYEITCALCIINVFS